MKQSRTQRRRKMKSEGGAVKRRKEKAIVVKARKGESMAVARHRAAAAKSRGLAGNHFMGI